VPRIDSRDCQKQRNDYLRGVDQSGSCAYADWYTAEFVGIQGGAISEGEEFAQANVGVFFAEKAVLGSAFVGEGILGGFQW